MIVDKHPVLRALQVRLYVIGTKVTGDLEGWHGKLRCKVGRTTVGAHRLVGQHLLKGYFLTRPGGTHDIRNQQCRNRQADKNGKDTFYNFHGFTSRTNE